MKDSSHICHVFNKVTLLLSAYMFHLNPVLPDENTRLLKKL